MAHDKINNSKDFIAFLKADCQAHNVRKWHFWMKYQHPELYYQRTLRAVELLSSYRGWPARLIWILARLRLARLGNVYGLSVPPGVFGRGLSIAHIGNIVVNDKARVGQNCRLHSGTNIGEHKGSAPKIEDNVYIGPGAVLFGDIRVGQGCVVGANSVVTMDCPPNVVVAGAPARVVREVGLDTPMPDWLRVAR